MKPENRTSDQDSSKEDTAAENGQELNPGADAEAEAVDARKHPEKLKENRDRLGVDDEHKTPDMKKKQRGTFP